MALDQGTRPQQWIQFQNFPGSFFWSGKPAVLSSPTALYAGYYVERGLPPGKGCPNKRVMDLHWHWYGFDRALSAEPFRSNLSTALASLPTPRCVWVSNLTQGIDQSFSLKGHSTLTKVRAYANKIPPNKWVDVVLGVRYSKRECLRLQDQIVEKLIEPLKQAHALYALVCSAQGV